MLTRLEALEREIATIKALLDMSRSDCSLSGLWELEAELVTKQMEYDCLCDEYNERLEPQEA